MDVGILSPPPAAVCHRRPLLLAPGLANHRWRGRLPPAAKVVVLASTAAAPPPPTATPPAARGGGVGIGENDVVDWVEATSHFFQQDTRPIMLFDGVCNLCNGGVRFVKANDHNGHIRFEPLQSDNGRKLLRRSGRSPDDISSVVLVEKDRSYIKSEAVLKIMGYLDLPYPQLAMFLSLVPLFIREAAYETVSNTRYDVFGQSEYCELDLDD